MPRCTPRWAAAPVRDRASLRSRNPARRPSAQRQVRDGADGHDSRHAADVLLQVRAEANECRRAVIQVLLRQRRLHDEHVARVEAGVDAEQPRHAHDQRRLLRPAPPASARPPRRRGDSGAHRGRPPVAARELFLSASLTSPRSDVNAGARPNSTPLPSDTSPGEREHGCIDIDAFERPQRNAPEIVWQHRQQQARAPDGEQQARNAADQRKQDALRQQLLHHAPAGCAERSPDGNLTLPRSRPCEHQVGHVHAGDEEHEADDRRACRGAPGAAPVRRIPAWRPRARFPRRCRSENCCASARPMVSISLRA